MQNQSSFHIEGIQNMDNKTEKHSRKVRVRALLHYCAREYS